jgi:hypothetical protein
MLKVLILLSLLGFSSCNTEGEADKTTVSNGIENNNKTIEVDEFLNFTWSSNILSKS